MSISAVVPPSAERLPGEPSSSDRSEMPALPPLRPLASVPAAHVEGGSPFRGVNLQSLHFLNFCCNFYFRGLLFCISDADKRRPPSAASARMDLRGRSFDRPAAEPSAAPLPLLCSSPTPSHPAQSKADEYFQTSKPKFASGELPQKSITRIEAGGFSESRR